MKQIAKKSILNVQTYVPGKPIDEVKRDLGLRNIVKLASNENPYSPSPKVLKAMAQAALSINRYPDSGCFYLRREIAKKLKVDLESLIFGNGSDELIVLATRAFVEEGDEVIMANPSFLIYNIASHLAGANIKSIPLKKNFSYDLKAMKEAVTGRTKIIFLGNPDNPSGRFFTQQEVESFLVGIPKDVLIFSDEAYYEYVNDKNYVDSIGLLGKHKNIIVSRTFSKMYGLAGLRIGYAIAQKEIVDILNKVREPFNVNSIAQAAALACLKDKIYYKKIADEIVKQREFLFEGLNRLEIHFQESCTNFILINLKKKATPVINKLLNQGIIVRNMNFCGMRNYMRISIGTAGENKKLLKALKEVL